LSADIYTDDRVERGEADPPSKPNKSTFKERRERKRKRKRKKEIQYDFDSQIHFKTQQSQIMCFLQNFQEKETGDPFGF
jgi:hypothetical protein